MHISHNISFSRVVLKRNIIVFQILNPSSLSQVQVALGEQIFQTLVIEVMGEIHINSHVVCEIRNGII